MLRKIKESDIDSIIKLENETLGETLGESMLNDILTNPLMKAYVYDDNKILGYISVSFDGNILEILNFCVSPNNQNNGIGKKLLNYAIMDSYKDGCKSVILEVRADNIKAIHVYESFGFKKISIRKQYYKDLCDALVYEIKLNDYNIVDEKYLLSFVLYNETKDYIRYFDNYQFDKYYHNFYKIKNEDCIDKIIEENKDKSFLCIEYNRPLNDKGFTEIDDNLTMASFISSLKIKDLNMGVVEDALGNEKELYDLLYNDDLRFGEDFSKKNSNRIIENIINKKTKGFVVKNNNKIIGFINTFYDNDICLLEDFFIIEKYRRNGFGSTLFNAAINYYKNIGCNIAILTADNDDTPKDMYSKWGFVVIDESYFSRRGE